MSLQLPSGYTTVILGPSGSGKTTLLRLVAGLERPSGGRIFIGEEDVTERPPRERRLGMVFQDFALYPNMTTRRNILAHYLFRNRPPEVDPEARAAYRRTSELMGVELEYLLGRSPKGLSPGEQQRVALARCITRNPDLFLMDEPFAHLDQGHRQRYRTNLKRLLQEFRITTLYVTHDQAEAPMLADRLVLLNEGRVVQVGSYTEIYRLPVDAFVAGFLLPDPLLPPMAIIDGALVAPAFAGNRLGVRAEHVKVLRADNDHAPYELIATVRERMLLPARGAELVTATVGEEELHALMSPPGAQVGSRVRLGLERFHLFDPTTGVRAQTVP